VRIARMLSVTLVLGLFSTAAAHAQATQKKTAARPTAASTAQNKMTADAGLPRLTESRPGLETRATVKVDAATETALRTIPASRILSRRIEEHGTDLVYVFKMKNGNADRELWINAATGAVVPTMKASPSAKKKGS
jgi:uncharacterized membrane protein YkoI